MTKQIETVIVEYEYANWEDFKAPSNFYIINALGEYVFFRTRDRRKANEALKEMYGAGKYTLRTINLK